MGSKFRSGFEAEVQRRLPKSAKYEPDRLKYTLEKTYKPDWSIEKNGQKIYLEAKGRFTSADRTKLLTIIKQYPKIDLRIVFQQDNFLRKGSKQRYSDWARKHGIKYSVWPSLPF